MKRFSWENCWRAGAVLLVFIALFASVALAASQSAPIKPSGQAQLNFLGERSAEDIDRFEATFASPVPRAIPEPRPTMDADTYHSLKTAADSAAKGSRGLNAPLAPAPAITNKGTHVGCQQTDNTTVSQPLWYPPDSNGAVGKSNVVLTVNNIICIYNKSTGALEKEMSGNSLMGYSTEYTFDPQVEYDSAFQRFVITYDSFAESTATQYFWIAISKTSSPTGSWYVYFLNTAAITSDNFWDYPHLGMDENALTFTANVFSNTTNGFLGAWLFSIAKAQAYNGFPQGISYFGGLAGTLMPPRLTEHDTNTYDWFIAAPATSGSNTLYLYALLGAGGSPEYLYGYTAGTSITYDVPPSASEPSGCGAGESLDTLDGRFQEPSAQNGDNLYAVHTYRDGTATVLYYVLSGLHSFAPAVSTEAILYTTSTSSDWNPSITTDASGDFAIGWSENDPINSSATANIRVADNNGGNPGFGSGITVASSTACINNEGGAPNRWGDYSSIQLDPSTAKTFWAVDETIPGTNDWGVDFAKVLW